MKTYEKIKKSENFNFQIYFWPLGGNSDDYFFKIDVFLYFKFHIKWKFLEKKNHDQNDQIFIFRTHFSVTRWRDEQIFLTFYNFLTFQVTYTMACFSLKSKFLEKNAYQKSQIWSFRTHFSTTRWHQIQNFEFSYF